MPEPLPIRPARPDELADAAAAAASPEGRGAAPSPEGLGQAHSPGDVAGYRPILDRTPARKSVFEEAGGLPFFEGLVDRFYLGVEADPDLLALYPDHADLAGARRRLALFLAQYWGGPNTYSDERGQPRLYLRHVPFPIDPAARDRWLTAMRGAVAWMDPPPHVAARLLQYFDMAAEAMRNKE
jgi:hemoglobin